jgi:cell shape-determining protein MreC
VESRKKNDNLKLLRREYKQFRAEAAAQQEDMKQVLGKVTDKISDLKREVRTLKAGKKRGISKGTT